MIHAAIRMLAASQNVDGGWGSRRGRQSATEPTAFALLALAHLGAGELSGAMARGTSWLEGQQRADGSWPATVRVDEGGWPTSAAVLAMAALAGNRPSALRGAGWLLTQPVYRESAIDALARRLGRRRWDFGDLDPGLAGWPWVGSTASWVEPTAYALMALKKLRPGRDPRWAQPRLGEAEAMLLNRTCRDGGWNYGNREVRGQALPAFPDVTAAALIALRDVLDPPVAAESLGALERMLEQVRSGLSLGWGVLCLELYGVPAARHARALARAWEATRFLGDTKTIALAVLALSDGAAVFIAPERARGG